MAELNYYSTMLGTGASAVNPFKKIVYVDPDNGSVNYDGLSPSKAKANITTALAVCSNGDTVLITGAITDDVTTVNDFTVNPLRGITIRGAGCGRRRPIWLGGGTAPNLALNCSGWRFENIRFNVVAGYPGLNLKMFVIGGGAYLTTVINCEFQGTGATKGAINIDGGPNKIDIINCFFHDIGGVGGAGIQSTTGGALGVPTARIIGNFFSECTNQINVHQLADTLFLNNYFQGTGHQYATLTHLNIRVPGGGLRNIMFGNLFGGTYTVAGGYKFGTDDSFTGNFADHVAAETNGVGKHGEIIALPV